MSGSGKVTNSGGAAAALTNQGASSTFSGVIQDGAGTTALILNAPGHTLTLAGVNTYSGGTLLMGGSTLVVGNNGALGAGNLTMAAGTTLSFLNIGNFTIPNNIVLGTTQALSGADAYTGGTQTLSGANTYTGDTTISSTFTVIASTGTLISVATPVDPFFTPPAGTTQTLSGVISDGGAPGVVGMTGAGTLVLAGVNTYSGGTVISSGVLQATNNSSVGSGPVALDGGVFQSGAAGLVVSNGFAINTTGGAIDTQANTLTLSGPIGNGNGTTGALTKIGAGTLALAGVNSYSGGTVIAAGTLQVSNNSSVGSGAVTLDGGVFQSGAAGLAFSNAFAHQLDRWRDRYPSQHAGALRLDRQRQRNHRRADQGRFGDAGPDRRQHLFRRHVPGYRRHRRGQFGRAGDRRAGDVGRNDFASDRE